VPGFVQELWAWQGAVLHTNEGQNVLEKWLKTIVIEFK
jgi:hypothetical protein